MKLVIINGAQNGNQQLLRCHKNELRGRVMRGNRARGNKTVAPVRPGVPVAGYW